jgi:5-methylcytosine-specific restriction protein A
MPYKPKVPCRHPGCAELVEAGQKYCEKHKRMHPEENTACCSTRIQQPMETGEQEVLTAPPSL